MASIRTRRPATKNASGDVAALRDAGRDDVASFLGRMDHPLKPALERALAAIVRQWVTAL